MFVGFILPDFVQQGKEIGVVLAVDLFQFDGGVGGFFQGAASEEIGGIIIVTQHIPFLAEQSPGEKSRRTDTRRIEPKIYSIPFLSLRGQAVAGHQSSAIVRLQRVCIGPDTGGVRSRWHPADLPSPYLFHQ